MRTSRDSADLCDCGVEQEEECKIDDWPENEIEMSGSPPAVLRLR